MPVVLFADDLQWGDSDSANALIEVLRSEDGPVVLLIGSYRSDEADSSPFLQEWFKTHAEMHSLAQPQNVAVSSLTLEDCVQLTVSLVEQDSERVRHRAIEFYQQTGGNPLLLIELIGCFDPASDSFRAMPIHEVIDEKLSRLPEEAGAILEAISVAGQPIELGEAAASIDRTDVSLALITHMRSEKLVRLIGPEDKANVDTYHDKIRETVLDRMTPEHRRAMHRSLALVIESSALDSNPQDPLEIPTETDGQTTYSRLYDLSYHFNAAGESRKACLYALLAGEQASHQFSQQVAANQFAIARRNLSNQHDGLRFRIHYGEGRALTLLGQYEQASQVLSELQHDELDDYQRAQVLGLQAEIAHKQGKIGSGMALYADALRRLGYWIPKSKSALAAGLGYEFAIQTLHSCLPPALYQRKIAPDRETLLAIEFANRNSIVSYYNNTPRMLWTHLKGLNLAETRLPSRGLAYAYGLHPAPVAVLGLVRRGLRYSDVAIEFAKKSNDMLTRGHCYAMRSMAQFAAGDYASSRNNAEESIRLLTEAGDPYIIFIADVHRSFSLWRLGETQTSIECAASAFSRAVRLGEDASAGGLMLAMAWATNGNFQFQQMQACFRVNEQDPLTTSWLRHAEGLWHLRAERYCEAANSLQAAWTIALRHLVIVPYTLCSSAWLATALRRQAETITNDLRRRSRLVRQARKSLRPALWLSRFYVSERAHALREHGILLHLEGRTHAATKQLTRSLEVAKRQGDRWQQMFSSLELGRIQAAQGDPEGKRRVEEETANLIRVEDEIRKAIGNGT
jgi:two-component system sensor kinase